MDPVAKILGADVELGNVIENGHAAAMPNDRAARLLLAQIEGVPGSGVGINPYAVYGGYAGYASYGSRGGYSRAADGAQVEHDPQDWGRKFLTTNGGCAYIDLGHLELCIPEVRSARDFVCHHQANLALARSAREAAAARLHDGQRLVVMANNSDRLGNSWGGHLNVLITRELWRRIFERMYPELFVIAAFQTSSILYTGQGKVGSENTQPWVPYQITQRGDFFECLVGEQTTYRRPIINARDEAHCGPASGGLELARLHVIFHDTTLTPVSNYLKAGVSQLVLALLETGWCDKQLMLANPLDALTAWGHDPDLGASAALADGRSITAIAHQRLFLEPVKAFVARGDASCVPDAQEIVALWEDTLDRLERRSADDTEVLARRLDWVLKRELLSRAIARHPGLDWASPAIRAADLRFASLGGDGLYDAVAAVSGVDAWVTEAELERAQRVPPEDTRAWLRTMLLRQAGPRGIARVNWDEVCLNPAAAREPPLVVRLDDPRCHTRADVQSHWAASQAGLTQAGPIPVAT